MKEKRFSIRDLLALITIIAVIFAFVVPAVLKARAIARRANCRNNFKQIMLAVHNYHSAYKVLPAAMGGSSGNATRLSGLIALTPFCEGQATWEAIANPLGANGATYPAMGPVPWNKNYPPWKTMFQVYRCPSETSSGNRPNHPFGLTNAVFCIGDSVLDIHKPKPLNEVRGMFAPRHQE